MSACSTTFEVMPEFCNRDRDDQSELTALLDELARPRPYEHLLRTIQGLRREEALERVVLWPRMRRARADAATRARISAHVARAVQRAEPLRIINDIGGYKSVACRTAPEVGWSEAFSVAAVMRWLMTMAEVHEPGVEIEYVGSGPVAVIIDNYRQADVDRYERGFCSLLEAVAKDAGHGIEVRYTSITRWYAEVELRNILEALAEAPATPAECERIGNALGHAERHFVRNGNENLTALSAAQLQARLRRSALQLHRWGVEDRRRRASWLDERIAISHGSETPDHAAVKSMPDSGLVFWVSNAAVAYSSDGWHPTLIAPGDPRLESTTERPVKSWASDISPGMRSILVASGSDAHNASILTTKEQQA